jgi:hypothetical protein
MTYLSEHLREESRSRSLFKRQTLEIALLNVTNALSS